MPPSAHAGTPNSADFQRRKLHLALLIMGVGMGLALLWCGIEGWGLGMGYPYNTILASPKIRFNDLTDMILDASRPNPYSEPFAPYLPFAWVFLRVIGAMSYHVGLTVYLSVSLGGLFILLFTALARLVASPWQCGFLSLSFLAVSYPVLFTIDRANLELFLVLLVAGFLVYCVQCKYQIGALCLLLVASFKLYPALFFLLLLRQRRVGMMACTVAALLIVVYLSLYALAIPLETGFEYYGRNLVFFTRFYAYENYALEGTSSLWNAYKLGLISAAQVGLISPVDFSFDGRLIGISLTIYTWATVLLTLFLAVYVCLLEKEFLRCAIVLLLYLSALTPFGADYRLLYANIGLVLVILLETRRTHDLLILVLLALAMVPKKEILLAYAGSTETGYSDVSIQVMLNPLLVFSALCLLLYDSRATFDARWTQLRLGRLIRTVVSGQSSFRGLHHPAKMM